MNFKSNHQEPHRLEGEQLYCPLCNFQDTHLEKIEQGQIEGRLAVKLHFTCEAGCRFTYLINNHKGTTESWLTQKIRAEYVEPELPKYITDSEKEEAFSQDDFSAKL